MEKLKGWEPISYFKMRSSVILKIVVCGLLLAFARDADLWAQNDANQSKDRDWQGRSYRMIKDLFQKGKQTIPTRTTYASEDFSKDEIIQRYQEFYEFLNGSDQAKFDSLEKAGLLIHDGLTDSVYVKYTSTQAHRDSNYLVFGWHPYWMGLSYKSYDYSILNTIAYYAYDIDPIDGSYTNPSVVEDWKQTDMVELAHASGGKVQLTITCHKTEDIKVF